MKLKLVILLCSAGTLAASPSFSQKNTIDVSYDQVSLVDVLDDLTLRTGYRILFYEEAIPASVRVTMSVKDVTVEQVLDEVLIKNGLAYTIKDEVIVVSPARGATAQPQRQAVVQGRVVDADGQPMVGVTVAVITGSATRGTVTSVDGRYSISVTSGDVISFSFIGKKTVEVAYDGQSSIDVILEDQMSEIEQVVITGKFNRRLESETGSSVQITGAQLKEVGNQNVIRSLANINPSFMIMESLEFGSDPNRMPEVQIRGKNTFPDLQGEYTGNPNQPLFIMDGFEVGVEQVFDLDMNRVSTVTILLDASAKAIYGSKAGNGVVIIETIRPEIGKLRVSYSGSVDIEAPDLTGYNLMNAKEKYDFEVRTGFYNGSGQVEANGGRNQMDGFSEAIKREVMAGVDTYWLSQPLRVGIGNKHSLSIDGGDEVVLYGVGINYNNVIGVMKGSERNTLSGNMNFAYNYKTLRFRNTLELMMNDAINSPYGDFSEYAKLNPYWRVHDENGDLIPAYSIKTSGPIYHNPLYNATLNTKNTSEYIQLRNNFQAEWSIASNLRTVGRFTFLTQNTETDIFYPGNHTMFSSYGEADADKRGQYTKGYSKQRTYQADFGLNYSKILGKHMIFANANWNIDAQESTSHTYRAEGFGNDDVDDIAFAAQYLVGTTPTGGSNNQREVGVVGALNYSYDDRYLFDGTLRTSASSKFGADNKWGLFWSLGAGWNIHKEKFAQDLEWLGRWKIRGSVGFTGSQNFDPYQAKARYRVADNTYDGSYGAILMGLPNMSLRWQRVLDYNVGTDMELWNRQISVKFDYFVSITDDMLIDASLPPSTGFSSFKENLGKIENRGFDATISITPWRNPEQRGYFTVMLTGLHRKTVLKNISENFSHRNNQQNAAKDQRQSLISQSQNIFEDIAMTYSRPSTLYYEGQSMNAIWGVMSAGINPVDGSELFYDLDGNIVPVWKSIYQTVIGDATPKLQGNINISAGFKGFTFALSCGYRFGGDVYNNTLVNKLEYTTSNINLDRRIMQTWTEMGQRTRYKKLDHTSMASVSNVTRPTSRFSMKDNELYISSLNLGYDFQDSKALAKIGIERLRVQAYMNELFRFSSLEIERGTSYPFARNFSLSLSLTF